MQSTASWVQARVEVHQAAFSSMHCIGSQGLAAVSGFPFAIKSLALSRGMVFARTLSLGGNVVALLLSHFCKQEKSLDRGG